MKNGTNKILLVGIACAVAYAEFGAFGVLVAALVLMVL